jgi:hypothetical protein
MEIFKESFMADEKDYLYDYRELDRFLVEEHDPQLLSEQLDTLMGDLVYVCRHEADFAGELSDHYLTLRRLRDLFRKTLPKTVPG